MEESDSSLDSSACSSSDGSGSSRSKSTTHNWSPVDKRNLPNNVSDWTREHAAEHLNIHYSEHFSAHSDLVLKMGKMRELTTEQHQFVDFVNEHFTLNSPISAYRSGLQDSVEEDLMIFRSELDRLDPFNLVNDEEIRNNLYIFVHVARLKEFYVELRWLYQKIKQMGRNHGSSYEGVYKTFVSAFARLCYLRVEHCSLVDRIAWNNLYGVTVISQPDLHFYKQGLHIEFTNKCVLVVSEVKPVMEEDEDPPRKIRKKTLNTDPRAVKSASCSVNVAISLHDKVLGQHAGELLLGIHSLYADKIDNLEREKLTMVGLIIKGTRVFFTLLEMSSKHYKKLANGVKLDEEDKAIIYYSAGRNILEVKERRTLIADFMRLNNIED